MSDDLRMHVEVKTTADTSGISKAEAAVKRLEASIRRLGSFGQIDPKVADLTRITAAAERMSAKAERTRVTAERAVTQDLRARFAFEGRMGKLRDREAAASARAAQIAEAQALAGLKARLTFQGRMSRQQAAESRVAERAIATAERIRRVADRAASSERRRKAADDATTAREAARSVLQAERERAAALRRTIKLDNYRFGLRDRFERSQALNREEHHGDARRHGRAAWDRGADAYGRGTRLGAAAAVAAGVGTVALVRKSLGAEVDTDEAEIGTRQYGNLGKSAARDLRDRWAAPLAEQLGLSTAKLLTSWTDAVKIGVPVEGAKAFAGLTAKTSEAWGMPFEKVSDTFGLVNTLLTSQGQPFDIKRIESIANTLQHLAAKQSTTPEKLNEFLQHGAGGAQVLGMSQESALAFGSASTSLGNRPGESGRLLDYIASRTIELPRLVKGHGDQAKRARELVHSLGFASAADMDAKHRQSPDAFLPDLLNRFSGITNPKKKESALAFFAGREWLGELGRITSGIETYKEATKLQKDAQKLDAIGEVWKLHQEKLAFVGKQFKAGWLNILGEIGKELSPLARMVGDYFLSWAEKLRQGGLAERVRASITGFVEGLGFKNLPELLRGIFGDPQSAIAGSAESWAATARGVGKGIRDVADGIRSVASAFTGGSSDPEVIGRFVGQIGALTVALTALSPVIAVLGSLAAIVTSLAAGAAALSAAGAVGGAAGAGAGAAGLGALAGGALIPVSLVAISAGVVAAIWGKQALKGAFLGVPSGDGGKAETQEGRLGAELGAAAPKKGMGPRSDASGAASPYATTDTIMARNRAATEKAEREQPDERPKKRTVTLQQLRELRRQQVEDGGLMGRQSSIGGDLTRSVEKLASNLASQGARLQLAALSAGAPGVVASWGGSASRNVAEAAGGSVGTVGALYRSTPGQRLPFTGFGRRGIIGGGGGSASSNPANSKASAAMLDAIAGTESGRAGYDAVLGNGRYGTPSKPVSSMTLDEAFTFGRQVRARHGSSSALGRYQIVGTTMRAAQKALGLDGSTPFNAETQDRMARWIARNQGLGAWEGLKHNPAAMARAQAAMAAGGAQDQPAGGSPTGKLGSIAGQYDGLRIKGQQAIAGGAAAKGVTDLARAIQDDLPGGVKHFAAFNDKYHAGTKSLHASGLAFDTSLKDPSKSVEAAEAIRNKLRMAGIADKDFRVIDEYRFPSRRSTGGHLHTQFNSVEAAQRYAATVDAVKSTLAGKPGTFSIGDGMTSTGWKKSSEMAGQSPAEAMAKRAPMPMAGGGGGKGPTIQAPITIQNNGDAEHTANQVQRRIQDSTNYRTHDVGFENI